MESGSWERGGGGGGEGKIKLIFYIIIGRPTIGDRFFETTMRAVSPFRLDFVGRIRSGN